jgi:hypothetical protein
MHNTEDAKIWLEKILLAVEDNKGNLGENGDN